jgi:hypothetical protein
VLLLVLIIATYANHFQNTFHRDDGHTIITNTSIRDLGNIPLFFRDGTTFSSLPSNQSYRPLVSTLLAIDYWLAHGLQPFWFHLSIFTLFIALTLLLALVIHHLLEREREKRPHLLTAGLRPAPPRATRFIPQTLTPSTMSSPRRM